MKAVFDRANALGLLSEKPEGAIDSTGLETRHISSHYLHRRGSKRTHSYTRWPKITVVCDTQTHLFCACVVSRGSNNDAPHFRPALIQASRYISFDRLLADPGFDSEANHRLAREELGIRLTVIALNRRRGPNTAAKGKYRSQMDRCFPYRIYNQRWQIESDFSRHKRLLGSALRARQRWSRERECYLRILTHNLMILKRVA